MEADRRVESNNLEYIVEVAVLRRGLTAGWLVNRKPNYDSFLPVDVPGCVNGLNGSRRNGSDHLYKILCVEL